MLKTFRASFVIKGSFAEKRNVILNIGENYIPARNDRQLDIESTLN